jgi:hypothetical protein
MYSHDRTRHVESHHFCKHRSPDFHQWLGSAYHASDVILTLVSDSIIYDSDEPNARLIGIEYIVSEKVCFGS